MSWNFDAPVEPRTCSCGSGRPREPEYDARGIFLTYVCAECREEKLGIYRPDVLTDSNYWADEEIDGDDW